MSLDVEAGIQNEERIPLVKIVGGGTLSNEDEVEWTRCCEEITPPCLSNTEKEADDKRGETISDVVDDQTVESKMKYRIDICEEKGERAFNFMKIKTKSSGEEVAKDAAKFVEIAEFGGPLPPLICVDDAKKVNDSWVEMLKRMQKEKLSRLVFLTNGLGQQILSSMDDPLAVNTVCVISTSFVTGTAVKDSDHNEKYLGVLDRQKLEQLGLKSGQYGKINGA